MARIAFWGTPALTTTYLDALLSAGMTPVVIITNPDRPKGRGQQLTPTPAKEWALEHNIPVLQPEKLDAVFVTELKQYTVDVSIVVAYGKIISQELIDLPKHKTLNVHYSLLPKYRGAAPTESAILHGDTETGCSIQVMAFKLDSGPIIAEETTPIEATETTTLLRGRLSEIGARLLVETLPKYLAGEITPVDQDDSLATRSGKIKKEDGLIDPNGDAIESYKKFRAYIEWPRTYFFHNDKRVIITQAHIENTQFIIDKVLPEGKKEITYTEFLRNQQ
jgi:methionyl-tRNA formyltransferase